MVSQQWRDRLIEAIRHQGMPNSYVERLVGELSDHADSILSEDQSMDAEQLDARLGTPEQLAETAKREFEQRTFAGRHPIVMFLAGPVVVVFGMLIATCLTVALGYWLIDWSIGGSLTANDMKDLPPSSYEMGIVQACNVVVRFIPFVISAWIFAASARRSGHRTWGFISCGIVAAVAIAFCATVNPQTALSKATWQMGFSWLIGVDQMLQAAVPLALAAWMLRRSKWQINSPKLSMRCNE